MTAILPIRCSTVALGQENQISDRRMKWHWVEPGVVVDEDVTV
jgi:hypothetical protein